MKVTGETFSFLQKEKKSRRGKIPKVFKLSGKKTVTGQNSGEFYNKKHQGSIPECQENPYRLYINELFHNNSGRIFQVKGQNKKVI